MERNYAEENIRKHLAIMEKLQKSTVDLKELFLAPFKDPRIDYICGEILRGFLKKSYHARQITFSRPARIPEGANDTPFPDEIWIHVLYRADDATIMAIKRVSRKFYHLARSALTNWANECVWRGPGSPNTAIHYYEKVESYTEHTFTTLYFDCGDVSVNFITSGSVKRAKMQICNSVSSQGSFWGPTKHLGVKIDGVETALNSGEIFHGDYHYRFIDCCGGFVAFGRDSPTIGFRCQYCPRKCVDRTCGSFRIAGTKKYATVAPLIKIAPAYIDAIISGACCAANRNRE